jgi:hypothetical protein
MGDAELKNYRSQKLMRLAAQKCGITSLADNQTCLESKRLGFTKSHSYQTKKMGLRTKFTIGARKLHNASVKLESREIAVHTYTEDHTPHSTLNRQASSGSYISNYDAYSKSLETSIKEVRPTKAHLGSLGRRVALGKLNQTGEDVGQTSKELRCLQAKVDMQSSLAGVKVRSSAARCTDLVTRQFRDELLDVRAKKPLSQLLKTKGQRGIARWSESCKRIKKLHLHAVRSKQDSSVLGFVTGSQLMATKVGLYIPNCTPSISTKRSSSRSSTESYDSWNYGEQAFMQSRHI